MILYNTNKNNNADEKGSIIATFDMPYSPFMSYRIRLPKVFSYIIELKKKNMQ